MRLYPAHGEKPTLALDDMSDRDLAGARGPAVRPPALRAAAPMVPAQNPNVQAGQAPEPRRVLRSIAARDRRRFRLMRDAPG